ncbi:MAG: LysM peptidoglycan-binding domain-containing protein [Chloroflexota bacterium]
MSYSRGGGRPPPPDEALMATCAVFGHEKGGYMNRTLFLLFIFCSLFLISAMPAAAENQTWTVRPGDSLDIIATTLEIPKEEIKNQNPRVLETNIQIGQKLKLPLRSYAESKALEKELSKKDARIGQLERTSSDSEAKLASAESQLRWQPIWFWGFWLFFGVIAFIVSGACWIFRQTHPRVFEEPHERSIGDLRESQIRVWSSFPHEEDLQVATEAHGSRY